MCIRDRSSHILPWLKSHGYTPDRNFRPKLPDRYLMPHVLQIQLYKPPPLQSPDIVISHYTNPVMSQSFTAYQHSRLVQFLAGFVLPAGIHFALIPLSCSLIYPIVRDFFYRSRILPVNIRCIFSPVCMYICTLVDVLPYLFSVWSVLNPFHNLFRIFSDNGTKTLPAALSVTDKYIILCLLYTSRCV